MADQSTQSITIAAPPRVMAVIADFAAYPTWAGSVKKADVLESFPDGRAKTVSFAIDAGMLKDTYDLEYVWTGDERVDGRSSKARCSARKRVPTCSADGRRTEVTYSLTVDLAIPMLGMLKRKPEKMVMDTALKELKKHVESPPA